MGLEKNNYYRKNYTSDGYIMKYRKAERGTFSRNRVLQFKIELSEILPLIWRRIMVPSDSNFWDLHVAIQDSMGWKDYHLHYFMIKGKHKRKEVKIGIPDFELFDEDENIYPGWEIPVLTYFNDLGITAKYRYDYGDSWWHSIKLEGYLHREKNIRYPICVEGASACPPEDCGGELGYYKLIEVLSNPDDPEYEETKAWAGENWNPDYFNRAEITFDNPYRRWKNAFLKD
jgi:hypothetical protein